MVTTTHAAPRVSVVTPVHNGEPFLSACIESVLAQTYGDYEYVICENHSTDDTAVIVARYAALDPRIRVVRPPRFLSQIADWNFAAGQVSPDSAYVKFVHADDTIAPTCLEHMVAVADAHPTAGMVGSLRRLGDGAVDLDGIPDSAELVGGRWLVRHQLLGGRYTTGPPTATLLRVSALREAGGYDESYIHADDWFAYKLLLGADFAYVPEVLTFTRLHSTSTTAWCERIGTWTPEHLRMLLELGPEVLSPTELAARATRWERAYALILVKALVATKLLRDSEMRAYHRRALRQIDAEARAAGRRLAAPLRLIHVLLDPGHRGGPEAAAL